MPLRKCLYGMVALALAPSVGSAAPIELISNGGFESGSFSGWTNTPVTTVVTNGGNGFGTFPAAGPASGNYAAQMSLIGVLNQSLSQSFSTLGQPFVEISFDYRVQSVDTNGLYPLIPINNAADPFTVSVNGNTLLNTAVNDPPGFLNFNATDTGWLHFSTGVIPVSNLGVPGPGDTYTIGFSLNNDDSLGESTRVFVDNVSGSQRQSPRRWRSSA